MADFDLIVVGGGPAGMAAARRVREKGLSVAVIDEQQRPGGQILRQPPAVFRVAGWLAERSYRPVKAELAAFEATQGIAWLGGRSAIGAAREGDGFVVHAAGPGDLLRVAGRRLLIAAGCYDLPVPLPGWTLPGVMSAGGVQAFLKSQQIVPGDRFVLAGTHPLMLIVAAQIIAAGGEVAVVAFDQPRSRFLPIIARRWTSALRHVGTFAAAAGALRLLRRRGVPVRFGLPLRSAHGVASVEEARFDGATVACDRIALCYGFVSQSDLPRMLGAGVAWAGPAGGWRTLHDDWMATDAEGLWIAGETSGVAGAAVALEEGRLAALGILRAAGRIDDAEGAAAPIRRRLAGLRGFTELLAAVGDPTEALARPNPPETIVCRCEDVTQGAIAAALADQHAPNAIKLATRCGMGLCQGRSCEATLLRQIARASGEPEGARGGFTARFPIRPARIGDLIESGTVAIEATNSSVHAD
ncbi:FAD/NAD(P)-dependent oxidoreductase [Flavisphingomonas formosensis]|uniref:FAD/NAD(P)-dependent oxidoreductase n=1 Tax=Flavisphingomonas formosensis TaxID=861534 RepID=UPI0018DFC2CC|nr:NAD(P)/FAD-dependent oxidoreductase [Sphingomonas formosensis]